MDRIERAAGIDRHVAQVAGMVLPAGARGCTRIVHGEARLEQAALEQHADALAGLDMVRLEERVPARREAHERTLGEIDVEALPVDDIDPVL